MRSENEMLDIIINTAKEDDHGGGLLNTAESQKIHAG